MAVKLLARLAPIDIMAERYAELYRARRAFAAQRGEPDGVTYAKRHAQLHVDMEENNLKKWSLRLVNDSLPSRQIREMFAADGILKGWYQRIHGWITYRTAQLMREY